MNVSIVVVQGSSSPDEVSRCVTSAVSSAIDCKVEEREVFVVSDGRFSLSGTTMFGTSGSESRRLASRVAGLGGVVIVTDCRRLPYEFVGNMANAASASPSRIHVLAGRKRKILPDGSFEVSTFHRDPGCVSSVHETRSATSVDEATTCCMSMSAGVFSSLVAYMGGRRLSEPAVVTAAARNLGIAMSCPEVPQTWASRTSTKPATFVEQPHEERVEQQVQIAADDSARHEPPTQSSIRTRGHDVIPVCFITKNRTKVASYCLESLCKNLKCDRPLRFVICDDMSSPGHVEALSDVLHGNGIDDFDVIVTKPGKTGLGASMNNGLSIAFGMSDIAMTVEDDWVLERELDITGHVEEAAKDGVAEIRLGACMKTHVTPMDDRYWMCFGRREDGFVSVFNNQCAIRHRRVYDALGGYDDSPRMDPEVNFRNRFNAYTHYGWNRMKVLFPREIRLRTLDDPSMYFIHVGRSIMNHDYPVPARYRFLYGENAGERIDIALVGDDGYAGKLAALIRNIDDVCLSDKRFLVAGWNMSEKSVKLLEAQAGPGCEVRVVNADDEMVGKCVSAGGYRRDGSRYTVPPSGLLKFCIPDIFVSVDKALYLDGDVIVTGDLHDLFMTNISGFECAAVPDIGSVTMRGKESFRIMQGDPSYFNSGVILMNLSRMRKTGASDRLFKTKESLSDRSLMDQDAFNIAMRGRVRLLPCKYNFMRGADLLARRSPNGVAAVNGLYGTSYRTADEMVKDSVVYHFAGAMKPWNPMTVEWQRRLESAMSRVADFN